MPWIDISALHVCFAWYKMKNSLSFFDSLLLYCTLCKTLKSETWEANNPFMYLCMFAIKEYIYQVKCKVPEMYWVSRRSGYKLVLTLLKERKN